MHEKILQIHDIVEVWDPPADLSRLPALRRNRRHEPESSHRRTCVREAEERFHRTKSGSIRHQNHALHSALFGAHYSAVARTVTAAYQNCQQEAQNDPHCGLITNNLSLFTDFNWRLIGIRLLKSFHHLMCLLSQPISSLPLESWRSLS